MSLRRDRRQERDTRDMTTTGSPFSQGRHTVPQYELNYMKINEQTTQYTCASFPPFSSPLRMNI